MDNKYSHLASWTEVGKDSGCEADNGNTGQHQSMARPLDPSFDLAKHWIKNIKQHMKRGQPSMHVLTCI